MLKEGLRRGWEVKVNEKKGKVRERLATGNVGDGCDAYEYK